MNSESGFLVSKQCWLPQIKDYRCPQEGRLGEAGRGRGDFPEEVALKQSKLRTEHLLDSGCEGGGGCGWAERAGEKHPGASCAEAKLGMWDLSAKCTGRYGERGQDGPEGLRSWRTSKLPCLPPTAPPPPGLLSPESGDAWFLLLGSLPASASDTLTHITGNYAHCSSCLGRACWLCCCHHCVSAGPADRKLSQLEGSPLPDQVSASGLFLAAWALLWRPAVIAASRPTEWINQFWIPLRMSSHVGVTPTPRAPGGSCPRSADWPQRWWLLEKVAFEGLGEIKGKGKRERKGTERSEQGIFKGQLSQLLYPIHRCSLHPG